MASSQLQSFEVLYTSGGGGKKKQKRGLAGGVDGRLTIDPNTHAVTLYNRGSGSGGGIDDDTASSSSSSSDDDKEEDERVESEEDDDDDKNSKKKKQQGWKKRMQQQAKRRRQQQQKRTLKRQKASKDKAGARVYSGRHKDVVDQLLLPGATGGGVVVVVGSFLVEIAANTSAANTSAANAAAKPLVSSASASSSLLLPPPQKKRKVLLPAVVRKQQQPRPSSGVTVPWKENGAQQQRQQPAAAAATSSAAMTASGAKPPFASRGRPTIGLVGNPKKKRTVLLPRMRPQQLSEKKPPATAGALKVGNSTASTTTTTNPAAVPSNYNNNNNNLDGVPVPVTLARLLRPHQVDAIKFLYPVLFNGQDDSSSSSSSSSKGAILADEPGLGKTLTTIALLAALHRQQRHKQSVVVCPSSLVSNWANEFDKWLGKAGQPKRVVVPKGGQEALAKLKAFVSSMKDRTGTSNCKKLSNGQVLILSYDLLRINAGILSDGITAQSFGLLVVDEGHRLKNTSGSLTLSALESLPTDARLCLTATPVQNNLGEFYKLADFCRKGVLGSLSSFRKEYERPIQLAASTAEQKASCQDRAQGLAQCKALDAITKTFVLRRMQKDILKTMLPPRTELLVFCRPSPRQCQLYLDITQSVRRGSHLSGGVAGALPALTALRKVCCHPMLYESATAPGSTTSVALSGKLVALEALLKSIRENAPTDKVVVVSNYTSALSVIENLVLQPNGFAFSRLDGTVDVQKRQNLVDTFNRSDQSFCFLLSSKAGGCGLNLIGANRLVVFDPDWNPASDLQAMGRVYRQGQTKPTTVYRLFTSGTIEEVIYQRQLQKGNLATLTVDGVCSNGGTADTTSFTKEELNDCFTLKEQCDCDTRRKVGSHWKPYDGPESLRSQGCLDLPMIDVADSASQTLGYVRIVDDNNDECKMTDGDDEKQGASRDTKEGTLSSLDDSDEEEFEF